MKTRSILKQCTLNKVVVTSLLKFQEISEYLGHMDWPTLGIEVEPWYKLSLE